MQKVWLRVPLSGATINPYQLQRIDRDKRKTWDITIFTATQLKHNRPDFSVVHKDTPEWTLVDIAVPADQITLPRQRRWKVSRPSSRNIKEYTGKESDDNTHRG